MAKPPELPESEGPTVATSLRFPEKLRRRLQKIADATGHTLSEVIFFLLRWGADEWEAEQEKRAREKRK